MLRNRQPPSSGKLERRPVTHSQFSSLMQRIDHHICISSPGENTNLNRCRGKPAAQPRRSIEFSSCINLEVTIIITWLIGPSSIIGWKSLQGFLRYTGRFKNRRCMINWHRKAYSGTDSTAGGPQMGSHHQKLATPFLVAQWDVCVPQGSKETAEAIGECIT